MGYHGLWVIASIYGLCITASTIAAKLGEKSTLKLESQTAMLPVFVINIVRPISTLVHSDPYVLYSNLGLPEGGVLRRRPRLR